MRKRGTALALTIAVTAALASTVGSASAASQAISCKKTLKIGFISPLTGGAGFLGEQQVSWVDLAVKQLTPAGLKIKVVRVDTPVEKGASEGLIAAQKLIADPTVVAVIGPATSGAVAAATQAMFDAGLAHISPSATRTSLTKGDKKEGTPAFFRVVPGDYIQGPTDANFMVDKLGAKKVVVIDFQEPYSAGLADAAEAVLKKRGVSTTRLSTSVTTTDFSSLVTKVSSDTDIVFFPAQQPADANTFAQQLIEQGKKAKVFGGDGTNDPSAFKVAGSYVSNFAPDITGYAHTKALVEAWKADNPSEKTVGSFGPPGYLAAQVAINAINLACNAGGGSIADRREVLRRVKKISVKQSILGIDFKFSTKSNDPLNAKFYIFQIQSDGSYKLVG
ncbi:MAG: hypothetical protein EXQ81_07530 [Thermoleophilia bacterium]|nr:hypothetical protein [Thermoleophilia bacterium]